MIPSYDFMIIDGLGVPVLVEPIITVLILWAIFCEHRRLLPVRVIFSVLWVTDDENASYDKNILRVPILYAMMTGLVLAMSRNF